MIIGYVGTPGSGKTFEAVKEIATQLKMGRVVYTNIEGLATPECREMIKNLCGLSSLAIEKQLKILEDHELEDFWNHIEPKCLVVIDEVQKIFSSREWQAEKNKNFGYWASTHRHHGFDVILITQNPERIDSAVRSLFEWTYLFRKVNFFGGAVQKKYICYSYAGDDTHGTPLTKETRNYHPLIFKCYKSYVADDIEEQKLGRTINVLKHPIIYAIPVVFGLTFYLLFFKSSFATGDIFGTKKIIENAENMKEPDNLNALTETEYQHYSANIKIKTNNGIRKYSNR